MAQGRLAKAISTLLVILQVLILPISAFSQSFNMGDLKNSLGGGGGSTGGLSATGMISNEARIALAGPSGFQKANKIRYGTSQIEKAYRLQYTTILVDQYRSLDQYSFLEVNVDKPWEGTIEGLPIDALRPQAEKLEIAERLKATDKKDRALEALKIDKPALNDPQALAAKEDDLSNVNLDSMAGKSTASSIVRGLNRTENPDEADEDVERDVIKPNSPKYINKIISSQLVQFGYTFFQDQPDLPDAITPAPNYVLGPGDVITVSIWGGNAGQADIVGSISNDGMLNLPGIGIVNVVGAKYGQLDAVLQREINKLVQGVNVTARLSKLRSLQIYLTGQVNAPGLKTVPAFSTVINALVAARGPMKTGSLRNIQILRGGKVVRTLDLYTLITKGQAQDDIVLEDKDVINVPYIGPTAAVVGAVTKPGIFELKGQVNDDSVLKRLLALSGDPLSQAHHKAYLRHFENHANAAVSDVEITSDNLHSLKVANGDLVEVRFIGSLMSKAVKLRGNVFERVEKTYQPGIKLSELLTSASLIRPDSITDFGVIRRYLPSEATFTTLNFPLSKLLKGEFDMPLEPYDQVYVLDSKDYGRKDKVILTGAVWKTGTYRYEPGMNIQSLLAMAGGLKFGANTARIELSRQFIVNDTIQTKRTVLTMAEAGNLKLEPYDAVNIPQMNNAGNIRQVELKGRILFPGIYTVRDGERLSDVIARAGGFLPDAYFYGAKYYSLTAQALQQQSLDKLTRELEAEATKTAFEEAKSGNTDEVSASLGQARTFIAKLKSLKAEGRVTLALSDLASFKGSANDVVLGDGDILEIPSKPSFVAVMGSVYSPNSFVYEPNLTVQDYVEKSGGATRTSDPSHAYLIKANGEIVSNSQKNSFFYNSFNSIKLMPGDTVVVPEDFERVPFFRLFKDVTDIVFKLATTAGVAIAAINVAK